MSYRGLPIMGLALCLLWAGFSSTSFAQPAAPAVSLYDTNTGSALPLDPRLLCQRTNWTAIAEDDLSHAFKGDAVFMNDRLAIVARRGAANVELYCRSADGATLRSSLAPAGMVARAAVSAVRTLENSPAAVMLEIEWKDAAGASAAIKLRLTAGDSLLEIRGGAGVRRLRIAAQTSYLVIPDFFADDMVFDADQKIAGPIGLPAENTLLGLLDNGRAILACVWSSAAQNADVLPGDDNARGAFAGYEIDLSGEQRVWISIIESAGIWHACRAGANGPLALDWSMPYPARWRADVVGADGQAASHSFPESAAAAKPGQLIVVYPLERTRETPLTAMCVVDVMRNSLGVGPCQYLLDAEGLGAGSDMAGDSLIRWLERELEKKPSRRDRDAVREELDRLVQQSRQIGARIDAYAALAEQVRQRSSALSERHPAARRIMVIAGAMGSNPAAAVQRLADAAAKLHALSDREDAFEQCRRLIAAIRADVDQQQRALASLRMSARRIKQECRGMVVSENQDLTALARDVGPMMQRLLEEKPRAH